MAKIADITILVILGIIGGLILLVARMNGELTPIRKAKSMPPLVGEIFTIEGTLELTAPRPVYALCLGDSQTAGYGLQYPERDRWCDLLESATGKEHVTAGYAGEKIEDLAAHIPEIAQKVTPEVIYLSAGVNDWAAGEPFAVVSDRQIRLIAALHDAFPDASVRLLPIFRRGVVAGGFNGIERPEYWADEWHPNEAGHRKIFEYLLSHE